MSKHVEARLALAVARETQPAAGLETQAHFSYFQSKL